MKPPRRCSHAPFLAAALLAFAACSGGGGEERKGVAEGASRPAADAPSARTVGLLPEFEGRAPEPGGTFTRALPADPVTLNPVVASDQISFLVYKWIFDPLIDMNEAMEPVGVLAESWETTPDGKATTFHLRRGVLWQDGKPFTADDVLFTYEAAMDPDVDAVNKRPAFTEVESVRKTDDHTVVVRWKSPYAPGLAAWVFYVMPRHLCAYPKGGGKAFNTSPAGASPVGTGPFRLGEWRRGELVVLEANPSYFRGRPHLDRLVFKIVPQSQTQFAAYQTGQLDMASLSAEQWPQVRDDAAFLRGSWIFEYTSRQFFYIGWNMDGSNPFFADARVRRAMTFAMNRQGVVDKILVGHGAVANGPFYPGGWESNPAVKPYPHDPAKAMALLDEAGWKDSDGDGIRDRGGVRFSFECLVPAEAEMFSRWLEVFQQDLRKVGVEMSVRRVEWGVFLDRTHRHAFQACLSGWNLGDDPDPHQFLHSSQGKLLPSGQGAGQNDVSYSNPEVDRLIEVQQGTFDREERREALWRIHELVAQDQPHTYLLLGSQIVAVRNRFQNVRVSRAGYGLFTWYPSLLEWWVPTEKRS
ncbi:MAG: peptide-binding protein [Acidobacteriota bacterium]